MYEWYRKSRICYAYLQDCHGRQDFAQSRWWTRGWTLQELLAPAVVKFYDANGMELGSKLSLQAQITSITGIDEEILTGGSLFDRNVAVRIL
ncbi:hypothetical protein BU23DRAFT_560113 [Bimuria novae-zelandiae CBS 107.79]|uniref:Heterokaryon incompatibility domain-containing protein n=1 Tax=Bimuria novae-zelandiae CBS 107.79 TaxID=1447943 RepID=A0A6A5UMR8_9PLEO|nr:hypothetical protein BU23DRAFT_560113 [Bimuria novae-zelandiae CBS 107.79]